MSMQEYETAVQLMKQHPEKMRFVGPRPASLVEAAEMILGLKFPQSYRCFLLEYGAGSFGAEEIYGVIDAEFGLYWPDAIWRTLTLREGKLPYQYVVVYDTGYGEFFCLDLGKQKDDEGQVVAFRPGYQMEAQYGEVIAKDFGELLLQLVQQELTPVEEDEQ